MSEVRSRYGSKDLRKIVDGKGLGLPLVQREIQVALAIMDGHTTAKALAAALSLSQASVNNYIYRLYAKTGAVNVAQLVLMMTGVLPCPVALLPVQRQWRRKYYKLDEF